jgi:hypothetical protein
MDLVIGQVPQGIHQELRVKSDGQVASTINDCQGFPRLAHLRSIGGDVEVVSREIQPD